MGSRGKKICDLVCQQSEDAKKNTTKEPLQMDTKYLMETTNLEQPDKLGPKEATCFDKNSTQFGNINLKNMKAKPDDAKENATKGCLRSIQMDAKYLMNTANLEPPNYLVSKETTLFDNNSTEFGNMNFKNIEATLFSDLYDPQLRITGNPKVTSFLEKEILDMEVEVEPEDPGCSKSCKAKMILEQDLYLSSDTDPFQSDDEYMDPTFDPTECKEKRKKTFNLMEREHQEPKESSDTNEEDENVTKKSRKRQRLEHLEEEQD